MYLFQVSGWLEYENEEHNGADVLKSQQTAISDTETSCLSLQIKPLNRELHWRSHYPDGSHMIYRGGGAALALICEQVLVKLPSLPPIRWVCGWRGGELHLSTWCPRSGMPPEPGKARRALQKPQAPASLIWAPLFWDQLSQLFLCRELSEDWGRVNNDLWPPLVFIGKKASPSFTEWLWWVCMGGGRESREF